MLTLIITIVEFSIRRHTRYYVIFDSKNCKIFYRTNTFIVIFPMNSSRVFSISMPMEEKIDLNYGSFDDS